MASLSGGAIAGIVVGSVVVFLVVLYLFVRWYTWRKAQRIDPRMPRVAIDAREYAGQWYEIAAFPTWFENGCVNTTARYVPDADGRLKVVNRCYRNGRWDESVGTAYPTEHAGVLAVEFFPGIYGNYTVTYRDPDTSVVTNADRSMLWILSRRPRITGAKKTKLLRWLAQHKFDTDRLRFTHQFEHVAPPEAP